MDVILHLSPKNNMKYSLGLKTSSVEADEPVHTCSSGTVSMHKGREVRNTRATRNPENEFHQSYVEVVGGRRGRMMLQGLLIIEGLDMSTS